jgi:hypothetical protein
MDMFKHKESSPSDNETFVGLIRLAREDPEIGDQLRALLSLDDFNRQSAIRSLLEEMRLNNAPAELISAFACLVDDLLAEKALELLRNER